MRTVGHDDEAGISIASKRGRGPLDPAQSWTVGSMPHKRLAFDRAEELRMFEVRLAPK